MNKRRNPQPGAFIGIGLAIGAGLGVVFDNIALGVGIGLAIGGAMAAGQSKKMRDKTGKDKSTDAYMPHGLRNRELKVSRPIA